MFPPGASEFDVQTFEHLYGLRLPPNVRDGFSVVNGAFCGTQGFLDLPTIVSTSNISSPNRGYQWPTMGAGTTLLDRPNWSGPGGTTRYSFGTMRLVRILRAAH